MKLLRTAMALSLASTTLLACAQIIGLSDTKDRVVVADAGNADASDASNATDGGGDGGDSGGHCDHNAECIDGYAAGKPALCVQHQCVKINEDLCVSDIYPKPELLRNDNVFLIPAFLPRATPLKEYPGALAYSLALTELSGGIPLPERRDVAMLFCASEKTLAPDALNHVVNELKLPAIIAGFGSEDLTKYVRDITRKAGVFVMNPDVTPEDLKYDKDNRQLLWSLLGTTEEVALAYRPLVMQAFAHVRKEVTDRPLKVALAYTETPGEKDAAKVIQFGSYIEDKTTVDASTRDLSKAIELDDAQAPNASPNFQSFHWPSSEQDAKLSLPTGLVAEIVKHKPDIIVALTGAEITLLAPQVDKAMFDVGQPLPVWLLGQRNGRTPELLRYLAIASPTDNGPPGESSAKRTARFLGIQFAGSEETNEYGAWLARMDNVYKSGGATPAADYGAAENFYDAVYWLVYGLYAGRLLHPETTTTDSQAISDGVRHLLSGTVIKPGFPEDIRDAFNQLDDPNTPQLEGTYVGALGHPNIDPRFGTWRSIGASYCYPTSEKNDAGIDTVAPRYNIQRYNADAGTLDDVPTSQKCHVF